MGEQLIDQLEQLLDAIAKIDPHDLPDTTLLESQQRILRLERRLHGIGARRLQVIDTRDITTTECGRSTRWWLVEEQLLGRGDADTRLQLARSSVTRPAIVEAMVAGEVSQPQASVIVNFLPKLDDPDARDHAEKTLLDAAKVVDTTRLTRGLRELRDAYSLDESAEARSVRQHEGRWLRFTSTFDGMTRFDGMLDPTAAATVQTALQPLAAPGGELDNRTVGQRRADALLDLAKLALSSGQLPETAGEPTQVHVTTDIDDLTRQLQPGDTCRSTLNGIPITPNTVRMLACDAAIIPIVMRGTSEILDLGRTTRTWTRAQRKAAKIRAGQHCEAPLCQAAIARCELHHEDEWAKFGRTDLNNGIYLCTYHHWLTHHTTWTLRRNKTTGQVEIRRT
ncbi:MAG: DUF222 domain-containing protein [Mycobacteriales bacterium]